MLLSVQRQVVDQVVWIAGGAMVVLFVLAPDHDSLLSEIIGPPAEMAAVFRWALLVAGVSAVLAGVLGIRTVMRERRSPVS